MNIPTAEELRKKIADAKDRDLQPVRDAAKKIINKFEEYIKNVLADPKRYTSHSSFSVEMPGEAYENNRAEECLFSTIRTTLPTGYRVEKSHDGGGMYSTVVIRWDEPRPVVRRTILTPTRR
jgi:hypothetical protein